MITHIICVYGRASSSSLYLKLYTNITTKSSWSSSCSNFRGLYPRLPTARALIAIYAWLWPYFLTMCPIYIKSLIIYSHRRDFSSKHHLHIIGVMRVMCVMVNNIRSSYLLSPEMIDTESSSLSVYFHDDDITFIIDASCMVESSTARCLLICSGNARKNVLLIIQKNRKTF